MACKRFLSWAAVVLALTFAGTAILAAEAPSPQEPPEEGKTPEAPAAPAAPEPTKPSFFGDRFALYIAATGGGAWTTSEVDSSITTSAVAYSLNDLDIDECDIRTVGKQAILARVHGQLDTARRADGLQFMLRDNLVAGV